MAVYFFAMHYATNITVEGLEETYHIGEEIRFSAKVTGFGDRVNAYSVEFQNEKVGERGLAGLGSMSDNVSYLNFPLRYEDTINYTHQTNYYDDEAGSYIMKFSTLGHTVERKLTLLP